MTADAACFHMSEDGTQDLRTATLLINVLCSALCSNSGCASQEQWRNDKSYKRIKGWHEEDKKVYARLADGTRC